MRQICTRLRVGDKVEVITGKDKGRVGKVLRFVGRENRVVIEHINVIQRHQKPRATNQVGQIVEKEAGVDISNVMLVCPECAETIRTGYKFLEDGSKVRFCKKCKSTIVLPEKSRS